ncbi:hypothetical protein N0V94_002138 [Neodidymelliopsis sp. IMI 364377]|nr:hypothetical protein N0V94_002138 [Neodidymelliopsis sp. IMI 364377]
MAGAWRPFQDLIEESFDRKYKELKGEGGFLIYQDSTVQQVDPIEERTPVELNASEVAWLALGKKEEEITEFRDPHTGSVWRADSAFEIPQVGGSSIVCGLSRPPHTAVLESGLTYAVESSNSTETAQPAKKEPEKDEPSVDSHSTTGSIPMNLSATLEPEAETIAVQESPRTPTSSRRGSRLPRPVAAKEESSPESGRRSCCIKSNAVQRTHVEKPQTPPKVRKDSVQPWNPQIAQPKQQRKKSRPTSKR